METVEYQFEEGLAMGLLVQRAVAVGGADRRTGAGFGVEFLDLGRDVEETLCAKKYPPRGLG